MVASLTLVAAGLLAGGVAAQPPAEPPELLPAPRPVRPPVEVAPVRGGYQLALNRRTAEWLADTLDAAADEKQLADALRGEARRQREADTPDPDAAARLELAALVVTLQLPAFKKALREKMGPGGAVVTVTGLQAPKVTFRKPRPALERAAAVAQGVLPLLPPDARRTLEGLRAMAVTTPLAWTVEPLP